MSSRWTKTAVERFRDKYVEVDGHWLWTAGQDGHGYGHFYLDGKQIKAQRASWILFKGPIPKGKCVLHRCDVRHCVRPDCLFIGTKADNSADMRAKGRSSNGVRPRGEGHPLARLNDDKVRWIRAAKERGMSNQAIADEVGITRGNVGFVLSGATWGHVK